MFPRAKYKDPTELHWSAVPDPVATIKYDGANFFMVFDAEGSPRFISRRPSVKGGFPDRTKSLPHLAGGKVPELAGHVFNVELIHTGLTKSAPESHREVSGILNSLPPRAIATQAAKGPVRAVMHNVLNPEFTTYKDKLLYMKKAEGLLGKPELIFVAEPHLASEGVARLISSTEHTGREGVIVTSLSAHESVNPRVKIKHRTTHNVTVSAVNQEIDISGKPKNSAGSLEIKDATGAVVGNVGSGFSRALREEIWAKPEEWVGRIIQVRSRGIAARRLQEPVYNGDADGEVDRITG